MEEKKHPCESESFIDFTTKSLKRDPLLSALDEIIWILPAKARLETLDELLGHHLGDKDPMEILDRYFPESEIRLMTDRIDEENRPKALRMLAGLTCVGIFNKVEVLGFIKYIMEPLCERISNLECQNTTYLECITRGQTGSGGGSC